MRIQNSKFRIQNSECARSGPARAGHRCASRIAYPVSQTGFTLVELLVSIVIIAILIALLLPAVNSTIRRVRVGRVVTEIKDLEASLANFKAKFGMYPPSRLRLYERSSQNEAETRAVLRRIWPQFAFTGGPNGYGNEYDLDGNGTAGEASRSREYNGAQCLVFFLGGVVNSGAPNGFSKNPQNPFASGGSREGPFFEFDSTRLNFSVNAQMPTYLDPFPSQTLPYLYLSAYDGVGYAPAGSHDYGGAMPNGAYRQGSVTGPYFKPQSFQIISPGMDFTFGNGGYVTPGNVSGSDATADNVTNFHSSTLGN